MTMMCCIALFVGLIGTIRSYATSAVNVSTSVDAKAVVSYFSRSESDTERIEKDLFVLEVLGILSAALAIKDVSVCDDSAVYDVQFLDYENIIQISRLEDRAVLIIEQGNIRNNLELLNDGTLIVDGKQYENKINMTAASPTNTHWYNAPIYGTASSYNKYFNTEFVSDVQLINAIANITVGAFVSIFTSYFGSVLDTFVSLLSTVYSYFGNTDPTTNAISYRATVFTITSGSGYINSTYGYCYRYNFTFYSRTSYAGSVKSAIQYKQII